MGKPNNKNKKNNTVKQEKLTEDEIREEINEAGEAEDGKDENAAENMSAITSDMANEATDDDLVSGENSPMVLAENLVKIYKTLELEVLALQGLDLRVERGELTAIIGNSGSGKSTFLNMLGGLDEPSAGKLFVDGKNLFKLSQREKVIYKRNTVGFVWQNNGRNLLPFMNAMENIMVPMHLTSEKHKKERALELLDLVGMSHRKYSRMNQLSGGEQQRIAIAIALANKPKLLLADEPTGSVDRKTADYIFDLFKRLNKEYGQTIIIVTHDVELSKKVARVVAIRDGKISSERILKEHYANLGTGEINWMEEDTQDEFTIVDRAGRIQIPKKMLDSLELKDNKIKVTYEEPAIKLENPVKNTVSKEK